MQYLGIDWGTRRAAWCAMDERGELVEGSVPADKDGLARLVHTLGPDVRGCVEMMSGAVWVRERLRACGWEFQIADARKVKAIAPLACKTDQVEARVLAQLARRDLVPELWIPSLSDRERRERLRRRTHLVPLKTSARNRMFGLLTQWGLRRNLKMLRQPRSLERLAEQGVPAVWIQSLRVLLDVVDDLERQLAARFWSGRREAPGVARRGRLSPGFLSSPIDPCMRFSRTRLADVLHRGHSACPVPRLVGARRDDDSVEIDQPEPVRGLAGSDPPSEPPVTLMMVGDEDRQPVHRVERDLVGDGAVFPAFCGWEHFPEYTYVLLPPAYRRSASISPVASASAMAPIAVAPTTNVSCALA